MKMFDYGVLGSSDLFLLDSYQDTNIDPNATMTGTVVEISGK